MPKIYRAADKFEFKCPAEVICDELQKCKNTGVFHWKVRGEAVMFGFYDPIAELSDSPLHGSPFKATLVRWYVPAAEFLHWLDANAAEKAYDKGCVYCHADLNSYNLEWVDGDPVCSVCCNIIESVPWMPETTT